jgi:hypothetical protein
MRFVLITLTLASIVAATAYSSDKVTNPQGYADRVSRTFAAGDNGDSGGWRECAQAEQSPQGVGFVCEGVRSILIHDNQLADVNYFCEFQFAAVDSIRYKVKYSLCQ